MVPFRSFVIAAGLGWSIAFVAVGLGAGLQMYADGSIFSYAVAVEDAWAFHWSNIAGRLVVYLYAFVPAELTVTLSGSASAGIAVYGLLHFAAPVLGLAATYAADRSQGRRLFVMACASAALLGPLVFGFPTEMWLSHAVFWPALAVCHYARRRVAGLAQVFGVLLALVLTHEGGVVLALAILATLALRGPRDALLWRATGAFVAAMAVWIAVKLAFPPDAYFGGVVLRAALLLINPVNLTSSVFLVLYGALAGYIVALLIVRRMNRANAPIVAAAIAMLALAIYWLWFDQALHTDDRYGARTALLIGTPLLGMLGAALALAADGRLTLPVPLLPRLLVALTGPVAVRAATGAFVLVMLVHVVETAKFVSAWSGYKAAVRALAVGTASDPALGDARFVSSVRISDGLNRLSWFSTTPYLSVLLAPGFAPRRLVVDYEGGRYFWLSCATARASEAGDGAIPRESRRLIRVYSCLHR